MRHFWLKIRVFTLICGDLLMLYLSLSAALLIRFGNLNQAIWQHHWPFFSVLFAVWLIIFYAFNLYDSIVGQNWIEFAGNYLKATAVNVILAVLYFYIFAAQISLAPKTILLLLLLIFAALFIGWRKLASRLIMAKSFYQNLLFIGFDPLTLELLPARPNLQRYGYNFKGIVTDQEIKENVNVPIYDFEQLKDVIKKEKIDLLVISEPNNQDVISLLFQTLPLRINFTSLTNFYEQVTNRVPLNMINQGWFLNNISLGNKDLYDTVKRALDVILALIFGLVSLFLSPLIALSIALDSRGKIIFRQVRVGKDGNLFVALKFRTMYQNAEAHGPMWAKEKDPRVTGVGNFLRTMRLDEIPQLVNIIKGEMSFVGPRPERPEFIEDLMSQIPFYKERLLVKPGLTGWAQIKMSYADSIESSLKKLQYDLYYVKHRSLLFDLSIILKTINIMLQKIGR